MGNKITIPLLFLLAALLLGGCTGSVYDSSDKKKLEETGRARLEAYFAEHLPGAEVVSVEAVEANREMTLKTLTNYVRGGYKEQGVSYEYYFDVIGNRLFTSKNYTAFTARVAEKVIGRLSLTGEAQILSSDIEVYLPDMQEVASLNHGVGSEQWQLSPATAVFAVSAPLIPIEAADDPVAYVDDGDRKEYINVRLTAAVDAAEQNDLSAYTIEDVYDAPMDDKLYYGRLCIQNALSVTYDRVGYGAQPEIVAKETLMAFGDGIDRNTYTLRYELWGDTPTAEPQTEDTQTEDNRTANAQEAETQATDAPTYGVIYRRWETLDRDTGAVQTKEENLG